MHPIESFVRNPIKVWVGVLLLTLFGVIGFMGMPMQLTPEVQIPTISIQTVWPGASPQEIEREIIQEQEEQLKAVEGVTKMTSESSDSMGMITLEFAVGTDMGQAALAVSTRLEQVPSYPENVDKPVIRASSSNDSPIAWFIMGLRLPEKEALIEFTERYPDLKEALAPVIEARQRSDGLAEARMRRLYKEIGAEHPELKEVLPANVDVTEYRKFAEDFIEAAFERIDGVSNANVFGGREPELQVVVDPERLAARGLTIQDLRQALAGQNKDTSAGDLWEGKRRWVVRTLGQFRSPQQVEEQVLVMNNGAPIFVRDVAEVHLTHKKPDSFVKNFGAHCVAVNAVRRSGSNVLEVMRKLKIEVAKLNEGILKDKKLRLTQVYDETEYIHDAVGMVRENIFSGSALTMITLMVFLHLGRRTIWFSALIAITAVLSLYYSWFFAITLILILVAGLWFARAALVISLAIPVSIIGTFVVLHMLGRSLNVISLAGMAFAVGMLVDNGVVVLENIVRHYQMGLSPMRAAIEGAKEVWAAVVASTLTTLAVFIPVVFVQEEAGQLFLDISLAISTAIALSLIVSVTLVPVVASRLLHRDEENESSVGKSSSGNSGDFLEEGDNSLARVLAGFGEWFYRAIEASNEWVQASFERRAMLVVVTFLVASFLTWALWPKVEYLPNGNRNLVFGIVLPPPGYNLNELGDLGQIVEDELKPLWDLNPNSPEAKKLKYPPIEDFFYVARGRQVFIGLRSHDPQRAGELVPAVFAMRAKFPGAFVVANQASIFAQGLQAGRSVDVEIRGPELTELVKVGGQILGQVSAVLEPKVDPAKRQTQARPNPSLDLSSPEVHVIPRLERAAQRGVRATELGYTVNALVDGAYAGDYFDQGDKIDLSIVGNVGAMNSNSRTQDIENLPIAVPGGLVPIGELASIQIASGPEQINHRERERAITIQVTPPPAMSLEEAVNTIEEKILKPIRDGKVVGPAYTLTMSGTADKLHNTWLALRGNVLLALIITYLLMAALFESWAHPFVIILSLPLGAVGGVVALRMLNIYLWMLGQSPQSLDVLTMLGFIILIGTVVNNPILIVEQGLQNMQLHGMDPITAVNDAAKTRIRPIFMTTLTTVLGLAPLVLFPGAGSELYRGLGSVLLGGLLLSTVISLVFIPAVFTLTHDIGLLIYAYLGWDASASEAVLVETGIHGSADNGSLSETRSDELASTSP